MLHFVDHSTEVEPVKNEDEEAEAENEEKDPPVQSITEIVNMDIFAILSSVKENSASSQQDEASTKADSKPSLDQ